MKIINKTKSFCPVCRKILDTDIVEKENSVFMQKKCPEHGEFESKIAKHAWYYKGLTSYYDNLFAGDFFKKQRLAYGGMITSNCNINCPICCSYSPKKMEDMSIDFLKNQLAKIKNKGVMVSFSGGEPTVREDLPEMIRLIKKSGNYSLLNTNGIKIADDFKYAKKLKESGLDTVNMWMDTVNNPEVYKKLRGNDYTESRKRAIENIKKLKIPLMLLQPTVRGISDSEIGDLIEYARKEEFVRELRFHGYMYSGRCAFSKNETFLIDDLVDTVIEQSHNLFNLEDVYYCQKILWAFSVIAQKKSNCLNSTLIFVPRGKEKPLRDLFKFDKFSKVLDEFEKIWQEDKKRAEEYFLKKSCIGSFRLFFNPDLRHFYQAMHKANPYFSEGPPYKHYLFLTMLSMHPYVVSYDLGRIERSCTFHSLNIDIDSPSNVPRCLSLMDYLDPPKE